VQWTAKEAGHVFFAARVAPAVPKRTTATTTKTLSVEATTTTTVMTENCVTGASLCMGVTELVKDPNFVAFNEKGRAPLAMLAFAKVVVDKIILNKDEDMGCHFHGLTITVPAAQTPLPLHRWAETTLCRLENNVWNRHSMWKVQQRSA